MPQRSAPRKPVGRPRKVDQPGADTASRILDHAEALFSRHGFHGVTLREIAAGAKVDTALVHYYFQHKQGLFDAVWARRVAVLNLERMAAMDDYARAHAGALTIEGAIQAFLGPLTDPARHRDPGWRNFFALAALVSNSATWGGEVMARFFDPVVRRLIDLISQALPDAPREELFWSYHMFSGALMLTLSNNGRLDILSNGLCRTSDIEEMTPRLVRFCAAGFRTLCQPGDAPFTP